MAAKDTVAFLIKDHGDIGSGFGGDFADDKPYMSILQRNYKTVDEMLKMFDWKEDDAAWASEYDGKKNAEKMIMKRRKTFFLACGWREINEDFQRGDVSCLRDIRTPFVTSRSPLRAIKDEFDE